MENDIRDRQIVTTRIFYAPITKVFSAWTDPGVLKRWWGPRGFTNTFHEFDLHPGGRWIFTMHGPDGGNYPNESEFVEIKPPKRIVLNHVSKPRFQLTADFEDMDNGRTKLLFQQLFETPEEYNKIKVFAVDANEENMDRLEGVIKDAG
jgi:uncharacterized protein YndB with AHSA1/START domain